jgi:hypothetical protein
MEIIFKVFPCQPEEKSTLEGNISISIILVPDDIKIVLSAGNRQVGAPPFLHPLVFDVTARLKSPNPVRAAAQWDFERCLLEGTIGIMGS